jgi:hypothetical protein
MRRRTYFLRLQDRNCMANSFKKADKFRVELQDMQELFRFVTFRRVLNWIVGFIDTLYT